MGANQKIYVNNGGTFTQAKQIFTNISGTWTAVKKVFVNQSGTWTQVYPTASATTSYTTPGTYSYTVPAGVYSLSVTIVGGGGGGGTSTSSGDAHGASNGGSGGYYLNQTVAVTPGQTVSITVGAGSPKQGSGGNSSISGSGITTLTATGGGAGQSVVGDNSPSYGGSAGSPNGSPGNYTASWMVNRNTYGQGFNGSGQLPSPLTAYGYGGLGGNNSGPGGPVAAGNGYVSITF